MRWIKPSSGEIRRNEGFLFFPKGSSNDGMRWLEYARWAESYVVGVGWVFFGWDDEEKDEDFRPS